MEFIELAKKRYSVRKYLNQAVEKEKILQVLEAGRIAPSACNNQPWVFYVLQDKDSLEKISVAYPRDWFRQAPVVIVLCGDHNQSWKRGDQKDHADVDVAIAADHMTLAATDQGLGTCWICAFDRKKCAEILELPNHLEPIAILPLGYPADEGNPQRHETQRKDLEEIVLWK